MRKSAYTLLLVLAILLLPSCEKDEERMDNYLIEFATVEKEGTNFYFRLDNGKKAVPEDLKKYSPKEGQRVILSYVPLTDNAIRINYVSDIFTGVIKTDDFSEDYPKDPIKVQSVWVGGGYLNLIMETEYHSEAHSIALLQNPTGATIELHLSHSSNNDPPGYPKMMYASFSLAKLKEQTLLTPIPFRLFINTYDGMKPYTLELK